MALMQQVVLVVMEVAKIQLDIMIVTHGINSHLLNGFLKSYCEWAK